MYKNVTLDADMQSPALKLVLKLTCWKYCAIILYVILKCAYRGQPAKLYQHRMKTVLVWHVGYGKLYCTNIIWNLFLCGMSGTVNCIVPTSYENCSCVACRVRWTVLYQHRMKPVLLWYVGHGKLYCTNIVWNLFLCGMSGTVNYMVPTSYETCSCVGCWVR